MSLLKHMGSLFFNKNKRHRHHSCGQFHKHYYENTLLSTNTPAISSNKLEDKLCPMCKNHCSLSMLKCEKGKKYAENA